MIVKACPRCRSIDNHVSDKGPGYVEHECRMCGKLFYDSEAVLKEFEGEKRKRPKKQEEPWLFPELERKMR